MFCAGRLPEEIAEERNQIPAVRGLDDHGEELAVEGDVLALRSRLEDHPPVGGGEARDVGGDEERVGAGEHPDRQRRVADHIGRVSRLVPLAGVDAAGHVEQVAHGDVVERRVAIERRVHPQLGQDVDDLGAQLQQAVLDRLVGEQRNHRLGHRPRGQACAGVDTVGVPLHHQAPLVQDHERAGVGVGQELLDRQCALAPRHGGGHPLPALPQRPDVFRRRQIDRRHHGPAARRHVRRRTVRRRRHQPGAGQRQRTTGKSDPTDE